MAPQRNHTYMVCSKSTRSKSTCGKWIWTDKVRSGAKCRKCGAWWPEPSRRNGKGKGPRNRTMANQQWLEAPPGVPKINPPLKRTKVQQEATDLLSTSWTTWPEETQTKLQALGIGPTKPEEPELKDLLTNHIDALPQQVQEIVSKLMNAEPITEREIAARLQGQVTDLKNMSIRKNQLQAKIDGVKSQYASLLSDMKELQSKLAEGAENAPETVRRLHESSQPDTRSSYAC